MYVAPMPHWIWGFFDVAASSTDITFYSGLIFIPAFFVALARVRSAPCVAFLAGTLVVLLLSACGSFAWFTYWLPGMNFVRHLGYTVIIAKIPMLFAAGFGVDLALQTLRSPEAIKRGYTLTNVLIAMALLWIVTDGVIGAALFDRADGDASFVGLLTQTQWTIFARMFAYGALVIAPYIALRWCH